MTAAARPGRAPFTVAGAALALVPAAAAIERGIPVYVAAGDGIWYQYRSLSLYPVDALVAVTVLAWIAARLRGWRGPRTPRGSALALAALALAAAASGVTAFDRVLAGGTALHLALLAVFVLAAAEIAAARPRGLRTVLSVTLVLEAALAAWQATLQSTAPAGRLFNGWDRELAAGDVGASVAALPGVDRWLRGYGSFPHPNALGAFLAISLAVVLVAPGMSRRWRAVAFVAGAVALTLSLSRSAWLALALAVIAWLVATDAPRRILAARRVSAAGALIALVLIGGGSTAALRFGRIDAPIERGSFDERSAENDAAWTIVRNGRPVGAGNIVIAEQTVAPSLGEPVHDVLLIALAEMGVPGLAAWLVLLGILGGSAWARRADPGARTAPLVAFAVLLPLLLLDHFLWTQPSGRALLAWLLATAAATSSAARS